MQPTPSPRSTSEAPEFFLDHCRWIFGDFDRPYAFRNGLPAASCQLPDPNTCGRLAFWDRRRTRIFGRQTRASRHWPLPAFAFFFHAGDGGFDAGGVPEFKGAEIPVEAEMHGAVDLDDGVGNFGDAIGGVGPEVGERGP